MCYVKFIREFGDRIFHAHMKDVWWGHGDGTVGVFGGHTDFTDARRFWDFRSLGHGDIKFEDIIVALNDVGYRGPLSVEWEDGRMDRIHGATESCAFVRKLDFAPNQAAFDAAFSQEEITELFDAQPRLPEHHQPSPGEWQPLTEPFQPPIKACQHLTKRFIGAWKRARIIVDTGGAP